MKSPVEDAKDISNRIRLTKEAMKSAGHDIVSDDTALLIMIYSLVRPQEEDRIGQKLAAIGGTLTSMLAALNIKKPAS
jgi:hypothetical protein